MTIIENENPNQITRSKNKLRAEISELKNTIAAMKREPIRTRIAKLEEENVALAARATRVQQLEEEDVVLRQRIAFLEREACETASSLETIAQLLRFGATNEKGV